MGELRVCFFSLLQCNGGEKREDKSVGHPSSFSIFSLSFRKVVIEAPANFPQKKNFINYAFCRNWAVRNPAGARLDSSSLVNKEVDLSYSSYYPDFILMSVFCKKSSVQYLSISSSSAVF